MFYQIYTIIKIDISIKALSKYQRFNQLQTFGSKKDLLKY
jgi:hypothetical protein